MQNFPTLRWTDQADPEAPLAIYPLDFTIDTAWLWTLSGSLHSQAIVCNGVTVDNSGNPNPLLVTIGSAQYPVYANSRMRIDFNGQPNLAAISSLLPAGSASAMFWTKPPAPNDEGPNQAGLNIPNFFTSNGSTGGINTLTVAVVPAGFVFALGTILSLAIGSTNTGPVTLAVSGGPATAVHKVTASGGSVALTGSELVGGSQTVLACNVALGVFEIIGPATAVQEVEVTLASAATVDLGAQPPGTTVILTGATAITSFGAPPVAGLVRRLVLAGAITLTNNAVIVVPGGTYAGAAGDSFELTSEAPNVWRVTAYALASGRALTGTVAATKAQMQAITDNTVFASPLHTADHPGVAKAWVVFVGTTGAPLNNYGVSSLTRNGVGDYTINFTTAFSSINYAAAILVNNSAGGGSGVVTINSAVPPTTTSFRFFVKDITNTLIDPTYVTAVFFGGQ